MNVKNYSLWTAVITPFLENGAVDFESLSKVIREQEEAGNGLLILGSTAEALNLNLTNRKAIIEHALSLNTKTPVMAGIGGHLLEEQIEWLQWLETKNIAGYLMVTPIYAKPGAVGQYNWFKKLMDLSTRPVMLYNVPGRAATPLSVEAVARLKDHKNFWCIKEASGSVEKMKEYLAACGNGAVYCGDDALMPDFAKAGSCGLVSVASNAWPKETNLYVRQCLNKSFDAKELWMKAANSLFVVANPVPVKRLMFERGTIRTPVMTAPLSHEDMASATVVLDAHTEVTRWFNSQKGN